MGCKSRDYKKWTDWKNPAHKDALTRNLIRTVANAKTDYDRHNCLFPSNH